MSDVSLRELLQLIFDPGSVVSLQNRHTKLNREIAENVHRSRLKYAISLITYVGNFIGISRNNQPDDILPR